MPASQANAEGDGVDLPISATDPNGYNLTYAAVNLPVGLSINASTGEITGTIDYSAAEDFGGAYDTIIIVTDTAGSSADVSFPWTITDTPRPPVLTDPGDQTNSAGDTVSLQLAATDPDGNSLYYTADGLPSGLSLDGSSGLISGTIDPTAGMPNPYTVTVTAGDGYSSASVTLAWTVNAADLAPQVTGPGDQINGYGDVVSLAIAATSPTGKALTYTAAGLPPGLSIDPASGTISGTIAAGAADSVFGVVVTASDGTLSGGTNYSWSVRGVQITNPGDQDNLDGDNVLLGITVSKGVFLGRGCDEQEQAANGPRYLRSR